MNFLYVNFKRVWLFFAVILSFSVSGARSQIISDSLVRVGFLNCNNLFDTLNEPSSRDGDFTPQGRYGWDSEKYGSKVAALGELTKDLNLDILGLCEVENRDVVEDMLSISPRRYHIIHYESSDSRGIDLAFVYDHQRVEVLESRLIEAPHATHYPRREALHVKANVGGEIISFLLVHLPSRRGGVKANRDRAMILDSLQKEIAKWDEEVVLMGDMNMTQAVELPPLQNIVKDLIRSGHGTYEYRGVWSMLDQVLVSVGMIHSVRDVALYSNQELSPRSGKAVTNTASDHKPLVFVLDLCK